ncbi:MAG TPA: carboxypeptidase-like regulatory domain-containing protein, partial [Rhodanobacteraceae bacterium]|nr:carboxypeptidase-like regulatory domain-containing protein [Rhodanobacteraceae bacterium]
CLPPTGTPIVVATGAAVEGIDFSLVPLNAIVGRVTNKDGMPLPGSYVDLFSAATHEHIGSGVADSDGYYVLPANPGTGYNVATDAIAGYYNQVFSGISCPIGPAYFGQCALTGATTVSLLGGSVPPVIMNFVLQSSDPIFKSGFENLP